MEQSDEDIVIRKVHGLRRQINPERDDRAGKRWKLYGWALVLIVSLGGSYRLWSQGWLEWPSDPPVAQNVRFSQPLHFKPPDPAPPLTEQDRYERLIQATRDVGPEEEKELQSLVKAFHRDNVDLEPFVKRLEREPRGERGVHEGLLLLDPYELCDSPEVLVSYSNSPVGPLREGALNALISLEEGALRYLPLLLADTRRGSDENRRHTSWALAHLISRCGHLLSDDTAGLVAQTLADAATQDKDGRVREAALYGLVLLGPREPKIIPQLVTALGLVEWDLASRRSFGRHYVRAALLQFGDRAWPALVGGLQGELRIDGSERMPTQLAMQILLEQGSGPTAVLLAEAERIHGQPGWQMDSAKVHHLENILLVLAEFGPAAQHAAAALENWSPEKVLAETMDATLPKMRAEALAELIRILESPPGEDKRLHVVGNQNRKLAKAIAAVGRMGAAGREALPALEPLLTNEDAALRFAALRAILNIDPASSAAAALRPAPTPPEPRVPELIRWRGEDPYRAWLYSDYDTLNRTRGGFFSLEKATLEQLDESLDARGIGWRETLAELLERGELESRLPRLIKMYGKRATPILSVAFARLGEKAQPAIPALLAGLESESEESAAKTLLFVAADAPEHVPELEAALGRQKERDAAQPKRSLESTLILAYLLWKHTRSDDAMATLVAGLESQESRDRQRAAMLLGEIGPDAAQAVPLLVPLLEEENFESRRAAIQALEKMGTSAKEATPGLRALLGDRDYRYQVAVALLKIAPEDPNLPAEIAAYLKEAPPGARLRLVRVLAQLKSDLASALPGLRLVAHALEGEEEVVEAAVMIWRVEQTPQALVALLNRYRTDAGFAHLGCGHLAEVGPAAKVAVLDVWPRVIDEGDGLRTWEGALAILQMDADEFLRQDLLSAGINCLDQKVQEEAFKLAAIQLFKKASGD